MIQPGDRVRITDRGADVLNISMHPGRFTWRGRRGRIHHHCKNGIDTCVVWDGCRTQDRVPLRFLQLDKDPPCLALSEL